MPTEKDLKIAKEIKRELKKKLGDKLISVTLYGSRARGTAKKDSDMDLLFVTTKKINFSSQENKIINNLTLDYLNDGLYISPVIYEKNEYKKYQNLNFLREVRKEGVLV